MDLLRDLRLDDVLADHRRQLADRPAVVGDDVTLTYRELAGRVDALSAALSARGVAAGDRLVWLGGDSARLPECLLASARLGAAFCPVSPRQPRATLNAILEDCAPAVVVGGGRDDRVEYESTLMAYRGMPPVAETAAPGTPLLLMYTMLGGRPVGMQIPRATVLHEAVGVALRGNTGHRVPAVCGTPHHIGDLISALAAILAGTPIVFSASRPAPRTLLEL